MPPVVVVIAVGSCSTDSADVPLALCYQGMNVLPSYIVRGLSELVVCVLLNLANYVFGLYR